MATTYTVKQVAKILGYSTNSIYTFLKEKKIKGIRLGKGRFRIPQEELNRILHLSKRESLDPQISQSNPSIGFPEIEKKTTVIPRLFDWFIAATSILLGVSMRLYNTSIDSTMNSSQLVYLPLIQTVLIVIGIGLLICCLLKQPRGFWHSTFQALLIAAYGFFALIRLSTGDGSVIALYGVLALFIFLVSFVQRDEVYIFTGFVFAEIVVLAITYLIAPSSIRIPGWFTIWTISPLILGLCWLMGVLGFVIFTLISYHKNRPVYWICMIFTSLTYLAAASWYAYDFYWTKSVLTFSIGIVCLFIPTWDITIHKQGRLVKLIASVFVGSLMVISLSLILIGLIQQNLLHYSRGTIQNKLKVGQTLIENDFASVKNMLEGLAKDPLFKQAFSTAPKSDLTQFLRGAYEGNRVLRRVLIIDQVGDLVEIYPFVELSQSNFAYREYFQQVISTKKPFISDVFTATDPDKSRIIVIAVPVIASGEVKGVLVGSINLLYLEQQLQKIADEQNGEYFLAADRQQRWILHQDQEQIGEIINSKYFLANQERDQIEVSEIYDDQGKKMLSAQIVTANTNNWQISLNLPVKSILRLAAKLSLTIYLAIEGILILLLSIIFCLQGGWTVLKKTFSKNESS